MSKDWRVRISCLTPNVLYHSGLASVLKPLARTNGVIFPYTPNVNTQYTAKYADQNFTHSNYRYYFYNNSEVPDFSIDGAFTAQDSAEATYMYAVVHFFRSATKMFYGNDPNAGTPPPILRVHGLGDHSFANHNVVLTSFNYELPDNVDYISTDPSDSYDVTGPAADIRAQRLRSSGLVQSDYITSGTAWMPTKMNITVTLAPVQSRARSLSFDYDEYASGSMITRGFW